VGTLRGHPLHRHRHEVSCPGPAAGLGAAARTFLLSFKRALSVRTLPLAALAFLVGRATVLQTMSPFGLALFAAVLALGPPRARAGLAAGAAALGILSTGAADRCLEFAGAALGLAVLTVAFERQARAKTALTPAALAFTVTVLAGTTRAVLVDPTPYQFLMVFFSALLTFILTLVYSAALPPIVHFRRARVAGPEEVIAVAVAGATALAGLSGLTWAGVKPSGVISGLVILTAAVAGGGGVGAVVGTVSGIITALCGAGGLSLVGLQAFSGLVAGSFREFGKKAGAAGYFFGLLLVTPLLDEGGLLRGLILEGAFSALGRIRAALEDHRKVEAGTFPDPPSHERMGRKLIDLGQVFEQLAAALKEVGVTAPAAPAPSGPADPSAAAGGPSRAARLSRVWPRLPAGCARPAASSDPAGRVTSTAPEGPCRVCWKSP